MAYDKVIDSAKLDAGMTATANMIRQKTGGTSKIEWDDDKGFESAVAKIGAQLPTLTKPEGTANDLAAGTQLIDSNGNIIEGNIPVVEHEARYFAYDIWDSNDALIDEPYVSEYPDCVQILGNIFEDMLIRDTVGMYVYVPKYVFGDASPSDVRKGVTFTAAGGVRVPGEMELESGGIILPTLTKPEGTSSDLVAGKQLIGSNGTIVDGTLVEINNLQIGENVRVETDDGTIEMAAPVTTDCILRNGSQSRLIVNSSVFGNATVDDVLADKEFTSSAGLRETGNIPKKTASDITVSGAMLTVPRGYYANDSMHTVDMATQATPSISLNESTGEITATATQSAGYVSSGTKKATKNLATQATQTITPGTSDQTIAAGKYLTGTQTIQGDANLVAANIKKGVSIFGVSGSLDASSGGSSGGSIGSDIAGVSKFTLAEDATVAGTFVKLGNIPWIAEHINDANLYVNLFSLNTSLRTDNSVFNAVSSNMKCINGSYAGAMYRGSYLAFVSFSSYPFNNTTNASSVRLCGDSNGNIYIAAYSDYFFAAGEYALLYGLI